MNTLCVTIKKEKVEIDKKVFLSLLSMSPVQEYAAFQNAVKDNLISFVALKDLAEKADVPYPLFFAPLDKVIVQLEDKDKELYQKLPSKEEVQLGFRGKMKSGDIELVVKDLGRKQEFFKKRILPNSPDNDFIGSIARRIALGSTNEDIAEYFKIYFQIDLVELRKMSKDNVLSYLFKKAEKKNILISLSSYNYMPQEISKDLYLSGFCVKDKKFPYIFINTRDGDENPIILETSGRQIFTLLSMLVCIGMNKFVLSNKKGQSKDPAHKKMFAIVGEILIPREDLVGVVITNLDELKKYAQFFKVTPSMLLVRLSELRLIKKDIADSYSKRLRQEIKKAESKNHPRQPKQTTGYGKYNGEKFSKEVMAAYKSNKISAYETKNILFRKGKMDSNLLREYGEKFK